MSPPRGEALFRITADAKPAARQLSSRARRIDDVVRSEFRGELLQAAEQAMKNAAPEDTGLLKDIIEAKMSYPGGGRVQIIVRSTVRDPATNFPYTQVTRFGHKKRWIEAKHQTSPEPFKAGAKTLAGDPKTKFFMDSGHAPALAVHSAGRYGQPIYRQRVRGYRPVGDWAERGVREANMAMSQAADRIGRRIVGEVVS